MKLGGKFNGSKLQMFYYNCETGRKCSRYYLFNFKKEGYVNEPFELQFVGFYEVPDTRLKINGNLVKVPRNGYFITPYSIERYLRIKELTFETGCSSLDIWCIY